MIAEEQLVEELHEAAAARITAWLSDYLAELLALQPGEIDVEQSFARYGLDSSAAVGMTGDLGTWLSVDIDPAAAYDYPTIASLSGYLAKDPRVLASLRKLS
jgi:acyl carrier protein